MPGLYASLVGPAWCELPEPVRRVHGGSGARAAGSFEVHGSRNPAARLLARLSGLPRPGKHVRMELSAQADGHGETWRRDFDGRRLQTRQWAHDGLLVETAPGGLELCFALEPSAHGLNFVQRGCHVRLGPLRLPLPAWLAPAVAARASADGPGLRVEVEVRAPVLGVLCRYSGLLDSFE